MLRYPPLLLLEAWAAFSALRPAGVVLTHTLQDIGVGRGVRRLAVVGVSVTHAPTTDTDVFYTVEVLKKRIIFKSLVLVLFFVWRKFVEQLFRI